MPPVIALAFGSLIFGLAASGIGVGLAAGAMGMELGAMLILSGVSTLIIKATQPSVNGPQGATINQSVAPRQILAGRCSSGGVLTYAAVTGADNSYVHYVFTYSTRPIHSYISFFLGDYECDFAVPTAGYTIPGPFPFTVAANPYYAEQGKYQGYVWIEQKLGAPGEPAFPGLVYDTANAYGAGVGGLGASNWTTDCRQDGCASVHLKIKVSANKFPTGLPQFMAVVQGRTDVYDPRTGATGYSENLALHIRTHLTDPLFGFRAKASEINGALFIAAANLADEAVPIGWANGLSSGSTEPRYACNGSWDCTQSVGGVLQGMLAAGYGKLSWQAGQWCLYLGAWRDISYTLGPGDFRGALQLSGKVKRRDRFNCIKGTFIDPLNNWQAAGFPAMVRAGFIADDSGLVGTSDQGIWGTGIAYNLNDAVTWAGMAFVCLVAHTSGSGNQPVEGESWETYWVQATEQLWKSVQYPFVISCATVQRLAKMELEASRREMALSAPCKLTGYLVQVPDVIGITQPHFGWVEAPFEVQKPSLVYANSALGVDLLLRQTDENVYGWSIADEQAPLQGPPVLVGDPTVVAPVTALVAVSGAAEALEQSNGVKLARAHLGWTPPLDQYVLSGGHIYYEYELAGSGNWVASGNVDGDVTAVFVLGLQEGSAYDFRVRCKSSKNVYSNYAYTYGLTVSTT